MSDGTVVYTGARFVTGDPSRPECAALAVRDGWIVGCSERPDALPGQAIDLGGGTVVPGFHDAHLHLSDGAPHRLHLDLSACTTASEVEERLAGRRDGGAGWLRASGAGVPDLPRALLDAAVPERPLVVFRADGHGLWLNGVALSRLGLDDPGTGSHFEEQAAERVRAAIPSEGETEREAALAQAIADLAALGVTSVQDIALPAGVELWRRRRGRGPLPLRVSLWLPLSTDLDELVAIREELGADDPWLALTTLKVFLDGALGARSAALSRPYADAPTTRGELREDPRRLAERVAAAEALGFNVAFHAIGDRAVRLAVDTVAALPRRARRRPHRIEHAIVADEADIRRAAELGLAFSIQPVQWRDDRPWLADRLGERAGGAYPWRDFVAAGATVAAGSDWPVGSWDPLQGIAACAARADALSLDPSEALGAYTAGGALLAGRGDELGRLREGQRADFVQLDHDPRVEPQRARVVRSWIDGRRVAV